MRLVGRQVACLLNDTCFTNFPTFKAFIAEANFKDSVKEYKNKWKYGNFHKIANVAPVKVLKFGKTENKTYICSTTDLQEALYQIKYIFVL